MTTTLHDGHALGVTRTEAAATPSTYAGYRSDIDGLRAIAVLAVVGFHAYPYVVVGGFIGVDIFFVISGFLISTIVIVNGEQGTFSYVDFYRRRVRRIFPALVVVLFACLLIGWATLLAGEYTKLGEHVLAGIAFISNFKLWNEAGYFNGAAETKPLLHLWSLAIEEQFYIVWPLVLGLVLKRKSTFASFTAIVGALVLASFAVNVASFPAHAEAAFFSPLSRFWELMLGGLLAYLTLHRPALFSRFREARSGLGFLLLAAGLALITRDRAFPGWWAMLPTAGAALLISAGPLSWGNRHLLSNPVAVWFGKISYPLYLWHWPLLSLAVIRNNGEPIPHPMRMALVLASIGLAWLTYRWVEMPIRAGRRVSTEVLVGAFVAVGALAAAVTVLEGLPHRAVNEDEARLFLDRYAKLRQFGLSKYYQERCDFYDWPSRGNKGKIDPACTATAGPGPVYLLWGDSHMQALSHGFRTSLASSAQLAQIATSGCKAKLHDDVNDGANKAACKASNELAISFIRTHRPARVFIAQEKDHELTDWAEIAEFVGSHGGQLVLVGPVPQWRPSLPARVAHDLTSNREYLGDGLAANIFATDAKLRDRYRLGKVRYASVIARLCRANECRARVPSTDGFDLLVMDYGHLTPAGSAYVVADLLPQLLEAAPGPEAKP